MKRYYCNGKKGICPYGDECSGMCGDCEHYNGEGGAYIEVDSEPKESEVAQRPEVLNDQSGGLSDPEGDRAEARKNERQTDA